MNDAKPAQRLWLALALAGSFALQPSLADAQAGDRKAAAETLFQKGKELMAQNKPEDACPKFEESQRLDPSVGTMLNLARCHSELGRTATAWAEYKQAATMARAAGQTDREQGAKEYADKLEPKLSFLTITVETRTAGLRIKRDGEEVGSPSFGMPIAVDPGKHTIEVSAPGFDTWSTTIEIGKEADKQTVNVPNLSPAAATDPHAGKPSPQGTNGLRIASYVTLGLGVVGLGVGGAFGGLAASEKSKADSLCPDKRCNAEGYDHIQSAESKALISTVGLAAGGALVGTGVVLFVLSRSAGKGAESKTAILPSLSPQFGGATLVGSF